jgi:hypothetical protein
VKLGINRKAVGLLIIVAFTLFPFKIFCEDEIKTANESLSIYEYDSHNDCPFCDINFYHDLENPESLKFDLFSFAALKEVKIVTSKSVSICISNGNKSPPSVF